uniref:Ig-like domain-containing protein n=1 Tax=Sphenodon punctatus TaxID=8508 RepID=A0A8D0HJL7_SPHPU
MAPSLETPLLLMAALILPLALTGFPTIRLNDQEGPILEGSSVSLECLTDEDGEDLSGFTFQKYSKWLGTWISLDQPDRLRCWFYDVNVTREDGRLLMGIVDLQSWHAGAYRCVGSNATGNGSVSQELDLRVEYLRKIFLTRLNTWCGTVGDSVTVHEGSDLVIACMADASQTPLYEWSREGDDWIMVSHLLTLHRVSQEQAGTYVCQAQHPELPQLTASQTLQVDVERTERSYALDSFSPVMALAVAVPAVLLLLLVLALAIFILQRRAVTTKKSALEDSGQRTPIYKGSLESVPSITGDTHPLVL